MTKMTTIHVLPLAVAVVLAAHAASGQEPPASNRSGSMSIGAQGGDGIDASSKLQQFEEVGEGLVVFGADYSWRASSGLYFNVKGSNLSLDDRSGSAVLGRKGHFKLSLTWNQNPNWMSNQARTLYTETSPGVFTLSDSLQRSLQATFYPWTAPTTANPSGVGNTTATDPTKAGFYALDALLADAKPFNLRSVRKTGRAALSVDVTKNLTAEVSYQNDGRDGYKNMTFYAGGANLETPVPIDYRTHDLRANFDFTKGHFFASAGAGLSQFRNAVPYTEADNPYMVDLLNPVNQSPVVNNAATLRNWLPPDNQFTSVDVSAGVSLPKRHKVTVTMFTGSMTMNRDLMPISTNPYIETTTNPATQNASFTLDPAYTSVHAKMQPFLGMVKLTGDPHSLFGYSLYYRKNDLEDKTPEYHFTSSVRGDASAGSYSDAGYTRESAYFGKDSVRGEVHVKPVKGVRLGVAAGSDKTDFDMREFLSVKDTTLTGSADWAYRRFSLHGSVTSLAREPGPENPLAIQPSWQGASQHDIAKRDTKSYSGLATLLASDHLSVSVSTQGARNEFPEADTGLLDSKSANYGIDFGYVVDEKLTLSAGYVFEKYSFGMAAAYVPRGIEPPYLPENRWGNDTSDKSDTLRLGLSWDAVPGKLSLRSDLDYSKARNDSSYVFTPGGLAEADGIFPAAPMAGITQNTYAAFPQVSKQTTIWKTSLTYQLVKKVSVSGMYWLQKFDNVDWANDAASLAPYMALDDPGANKWMLLGASVPSYNANIFRAAINYRF
jgi:MtrB/PioB family decaheme-associated outer membrane protein